MKKIFKTVMVFSLVFLASCDDYIDVEPVGPDAGQLLQQRTRI